jgi:2-dehydro-3-deoxy-D-arabinonate dehydratase
MRFIRVSDGSTISFCGVDEQGKIWRLNNEPDDPQDYVQLYALAQKNEQSMSDLAKSLAAKGESLPWSLEDLDVPASSAKPHLIIPYVPPEAWGAAFTYPAKSDKDPYAEARYAKRPVIFFKATSSRCVGPNEAIGSRADTTQMIPEAELGLVLASSGEIIGYTVANDVTSIDLTAESDLYVNYAKCFNRCTSLGPTIVPPESIGDATNLDIRSRVIRDGDVISDLAGNTGNMIRTFDELIGYLTDHNDIPTGTLLCAGSAASAVWGTHIVDGDLVEIEITRIGRLSNPVITA